MANPVATFTASVRRADDARHFDVSDGTAVVLGALTRVMRKETV